MTIIMARRRLQGQRASTHHAAKVRDSRKGKNGRERIHSIMDAEAGIRVPLVAAADGHASAVDAYADPKVIPARVELTNRPTRDLVRGKHNRGLGP